VSVEVLTFPMVPCIVDTVPLSVLTLPESVDTLLCREVTAELTESILPPNVVPRPFTVVVRAENALVSLDPRLVMALFTDVNPLVTEVWRLLTAVPIPATAVFSEEKEAASDVESELRAVCMALTVVVREATLEDRLVSELCRLETVPVREVSEEIICAPSRVEPVTARSQVAWSAAGLVS